jgi:hypothetical protein
VFEIKGSRFVDLKENGDNIKRGWITQNQCFHINVKNYNSRIVQTFALNSPFKVSFKSLIVFKLLLFILLFLMVDIYFS